MIPDVPAPILLFSLPKTGSTLLRLVLDSHPDLWSPDELDLGPLVSALAYTCEGVLEKPGRVPGPGGRGRLDGAVRDAVRESVARLVGPALASKGKRLWCEKSPRNLGHLDLLLEVYPEAPVLLLHRHPLDTLKSWLESSRFGIVFEALRDDVAATPRNFLIGMTRTWNRETRRLLDLERELADRGRGGRRVRYEDLVADPQGTTQAIFSFLGLAAGSWRTEEAFRQPHHHRVVGGGDANAALSTGVFRTSVGSGSGLPRGRLLALPDSELNELLALTLELGYPPLDLHESQARDRPPETPASGEVLADLFDRLLPAALESLPAGSEIPPGAYSFVVEGAGAWTIELRESSGRVVAGPGDGCEVRLHGQDLLALLAGEAQPGTLFRQGRIAVQGPFELPALRSLLGLLQSAFQAGRSPEAV